MGIEPRVVATCPESSKVDPAGYLRQVEKIARWCDGGGHHGLLVHSANRLLDPWVVAQAILAATGAVRPVITVQPLHLHPYAAAKKIASLHALYGRSPDLVLAAGSSRTDLISLEDRATHDDRYGRLVEYGLLIRELLSSDGGVRHRGRWYRAMEPETTGPLPPGAMPRLFVAASSEAGRRAAGDLGAHGVLPLLPDTATLPGDGVRVGILARESADEAERLARKRFAGRPPDQLAHRLEMRWTDSSWQRLLAATDAHQRDDSPWWLAPYEHGHARSPFLVGDHRRVARELAPALEAGAEWLFVDAPVSRQDVEHTRLVVDRAWKRATTPLALTG